MLSSRSLFLFFVFGDKDEGIVSAALYSSTTFLTRVSEIFPDSDIFAVAKTR